MTYPYLVLHSFIENGRHDIKPEVTSGVMSFFMGMQYGIAIRNVCVRTEPTMEPLRRYEGDVWDRRQESRLNVGETVRLKRQMNDWYYIRSDVSEGYVKKDGIFLCSKRHYEKYRELLQREYQVVLKSGRYIDGQYFRVGTVLPVFDNEREIVYRKGGPVFVRQYLPFTERQLGLQMERMLEIPYSWGDERLDGMDCSSTVRAFFACFGIALPRNSEEQMEYGKYLSTIGAAEYKDLKDKTKEEKTEVLRGLGVGAVVHMPGHVMIYAGERDGIPFIFHNCDTYQSEDGEVVVRRCVISEFFPKEGKSYLDYVTAAWKK